jgi:HNH endonuclease/NUMOD4 motif-containing protein
MSQVIQSREDWRLVKSSGFEGYEVSNLGRVRRFGRILQGSINRNSGHIMLERDRRGVRRVIGFHILVLEAFKGRRPSGTLGLHWDDDPTNNKLSNLRWGTRAQNTHDAIRNKRLEGFSPKQVKYIRMMTTKGTSQISLARKFGRSMNTIHEIVKRKRYR